MLDGRVTERYISEIPWNKTPSFMFSNDSQSYIEAFQNVLETVPSFDGKIKYYDSVWDFNPYYEHINDDSYIVRFDRADEDCVDFIKFFFIYQISNKSKISTSSRRVGDFIQVLSSIKAQTNHQSFFLITTEDLIEDIESRDVGFARKHSLFEALYQIYYFIINNYKIELPIELDVLSSKAILYKRKAKVDPNLRENIPEKMYTEILNTCIEVINNEEIDFNMRMTAGLIIILSQTGLRVQDLVGIKISDLNEKYLPISNVRVNYLHYQTRKPSKAHSDMLEFDIYASELCAETFRKMVELRKQCRYYNQPYLYILNSTINSNNIFPILTTRMTNEYRRLLAINLYDLVKEKWDGVKKVKCGWVESTKSKYVEEYLSIPTFSQFRVHLATSLYNSGISLTYIQKYLGHLSEYMLGYYVRPKSTIQEDVDFAEKIVKKIVNENGNPLGVMGEELKKNLCKFVNDGRYNVQKDVRNILNDLGDKLIIREKGPGLCCIKASILPCKNDARTNEVMCAYGLCPNIFHFYDMVDVSYMTFHSLQVTYSENLENGYIRAAQKELVKLKDFCRRRLVPEIQEMEKVLNKIGFDSFKLEHPELSYLALHIDEIKEEIETWTHI